MGVDRVSVCGCGVDLVDIERIKRIRERFGLRFLGKVFTQAEREYCLARPNPDESLAARFAAKEAVAKALGLGLGQFCWQDIEIIRPQQGGPQVKLAGGCRAQAQAMDLDRVFVSLSHGRRQALAQAIAVRKG
ncbi:MAG TPA: holo-ACP synthase [bacterium]|nr:holo-ACP synthase [bacterium]